MGPDGAECSTTSDNTNGLSPDKEDDWKPISPAVLWVQEQLQSGMTPRVILSRLVPDFATTLDEDDQLDETAMLRLIIDTLSEPPRRRKLAAYNTLEDAVELIRSAKNILVLTGAGVSVSCGIPDFRSANGIYARLSKDFPDLPNPQAMFDIHYFRGNQRPFFDFAREIYPGQFKPSLVHRFIKLLEAEGKLLANYTQNIDTLEQVAGISHVVQCHGSFATASCTNCKRKVTCEEIRDDIFNKKIPLCTVCPSSLGSGEEGDGGEEQQRPLAVMKPDIVFFGESLPDEFHERISRDKDRTDLLIIVGSSMKVRPVALIPSKLRVCVCCVFAEDPAVHRMSVVVRQWCRRWRRRGAAGPLALIPSSIPAEVPQLLINRTELRHLCTDIELLGTADEVIEQLCLRLGPPYTTLVGPTVAQLQRITELPNLVPTEEEVSTGEPLLKRSRLEPDPSSSSSPHVSTNTDQERASCLTASESAGVIESDSAPLASSTSATEPAAFKPTTDQEHASCPSATGPSTVSTNGDSALRVSSTSAAEPAASNSNTDHERASGLSATEPSAALTNGDDSAVEPAASNPTTHQESASCPSATEPSAASTHGDDSAAAALRAMYQPSHRNLAATLPADAYLFTAPSRCLFHGAEVYTRFDDDVGGGSSDGETSGSSAEDSDDDDDYSTKSEPTGEADTTTSSDDGARRKCRRKVKSAPPPAYTAEDNKPSAVRRVP